MPPLTHVLANSNVPLTDESVKGFGEDKRGVRDDSDNQSDVLRGSTRVSRGMW